MRDREYDIVIVEPDPDMVEMLVCSLTRRFDARITCVSTAEACVDVELASPRDLVIAELDLEDASGLVLAEHLMSLSSRPVILLGTDPTREDIVEALRVGVRDVLIRPFLMVQLLDSAERVLRGHELRRQHQAKYKRVRELLRRVLRERRDLNQRVELICRDLVGAHRRLVNRIVDQEVVNTEQDG